MISFLHDLSVDSPSDCIFQSFQVEFHKSAATKPHELTTFSLIGIDASIANAFRRILLAEIPTIAIEDVFVHNNTSIIQDEVLAHRLGLIPLTGNYEAITAMDFKRPPSDTEPEGQKPTDQNTILLKLEIACEWAEGAKKLLEKHQADDIDKLYVNHNVYAKDIEFTPIGRQINEFSEEKGPIEPVSPDILIAKMRPGQEINIEMHARKGRGGDHAKFSPVATASYRLMPTIDIVKPILGEDARKFARCFPKHVIGLEDFTREDAAKAGGDYKELIGEKKAVVKNAFIDTVSRECLRHPEFQDKVKLGRVRDHFIFSVETTGQYPSDELFIMSVRALAAKANKIRRHLANVLR